MSRITPKKSRVNAGAASGALSYVAAPSNAPMASDLPTTELPERTMKSTGPASESMDRGGVIEKAGEMALDAEHTAMMGFMAELITIRPATSTDPNAEQVFELCVNGRIELFRRGEDKTVPRYFADRMFRMKETRFSQKETQNAAGEKQYVQVPQSALKYDFQVITDHSPHSKAWQVAAAREAA